MSTAALALLKFSISMILALASKTKQPYVLINIKLQKNTGG